MPSNVEIKASIDDYEALARRAESLSDGPVETMRQRDVFFNMARGRLKLRFIDEEAGELIYYERPDSPEPALSRYEVVEVASPQRLERLLSVSHGVRAIVSKQRRVYRSGATRIHLDRVDGLGDFIELEVVLDGTQTAADGERIARRLMDALGVADRRLIDVAYVDLLAGGGQAGPAVDP